MMPCLHTSYFQETLPQQFTKIVQLVLIIIFVWQCRPCHFPLCCTKLSYGNAMSLNWHRMLTSDHNRTCVCVNMILHTVCHMSTLIHIHYTPFVIGSNCEYIDSFIQISCTVHYTSQAGYSKLCSLNLSVH